MRDRDRLLTPSEHALARSVFGHAIALDRVELRRRRWWPLQGRDYVMAPSGHIHFHPHGETWRDDFATADIAARGLFVHELVHIWQHQRGLFLPIRRHPFCRYVYAIRPGLPLTGYGIEQQAEIVRHAYLLREGFPLPGKPPRMVYEELLAGAFGSVSSTSGTGTT